MFDPSEKTREELEREVWWFRRLYEVHEPEDTTFFEQEVNSFHCEGCKHWYKQLLLSDRRNTILNSENREIKRRLDLPKESHDATYKAVLTEVELRRQLDVRVNELERENERLKELVE